MKAIRGYLSITPIEQRILQAILNEPTSVYFSEIERQIAAGIVENEFISRKQRCVLWNAAIYHAHHLQDEVIYTFAQQAYALRDSYTKARKEAA